MPSSITRTGPALRAAKRIGAMLLVLALGVGATFLVPAPREPLAARQGPELSTVTQWGYQLQKLDPEQIPDEVDLLVVDYSLDGTDAGALSAEDVNKLRSREGRAPRIVLSYLSIGEAEDYRYYWQSYWKRWRPGWYAGRNRKWKGNFLVKFWDPWWQRIIVEPSPSLATRTLARVLASQVPYLDKILEAGFDGVYLDRVDFYQELARRHASAEADMIGFVTTISRYAKARRPGFLVVAQNAEELIAHGAYRAVIDGIAKEDALFGIKASGRRNPKQDIESTMGLLAQARGAGLPVFIVEYVRSERSRRAALETMVPLGYPLLFARRALDRAPELTPPLEADAAQSPDAGQTGSDAQPGETAGPSEDGTASSGEDAKKHTK